MKFQEPQISKCFKHPYYDFKDESIPIDKDGEPCALCYSGNKIVLEAKKKHDELVARLNVLAVAPKSIKEDLKEPVVSPASFKETLLTKIMSGEVDPKCYKHPNYKGLRRARNGCQICEAVRKRIEMSGIRETRKRT